MGQILCNFQYLAGYTIMKFSGGIRITDISIHIYKWLTKSFGISITKKRHKWRANASSFIPSCKKYLFLTKKLVRKPHLQVKIFVILKNILSFPFSLFMKIEHMFYSIICPFVLQLCLMAAQFFLTCIIHFSGFHFLISTNWWRRISIE